jgi:hypothetical protein
MSARLPLRLRRLVRERAGQRCEYCLRHEDDSALPHQPDHITSRKHRGKATAENLAWSCAVCNLLKGPEVAAIDSQTDLATRLFNPRTDRWNDHFELRSGRILGLTAIGRVTADVLQFNRDDLVKLRLALIAAARYP